LLYQHAIVLTERLIAEEIGAAIDRAAEAACSLSRHADRITLLPRPPHDCELVEERWFHIGWIGVVREPEEWDVLYDPVTEEGRLRSKRSGP
jgi:hypothetical protein